MYLVSLSKCLDKIHTLEFNRSAQSKSRDASDMFFQLERVLFEPSGFHGRVGGSIHDPVATAGATQRARNVRRRYVVSHSLTQSHSCFEGAPRVHGSPEAVPCTGTHHPSVADVIAAARNEISDVRSGFIDRWMVPMRPTKN